MSHFILILNEPYMMKTNNNNHQNTYPALTSIQKSSTKFFLPLTESVLVPPAQPQPPSPNRHPTYLLHNFPHRPHYYPPSTVGAQPGYCLSPLPPTINRGHQTIHQTLPASSDPLPKINISTHHHGPPDYHVASSSASSSSLSSSSLPSLSTSNTSLASSSSSSSNPSLISKPSESKSITTTDLTSQSSSTLHDTYTPPSSSSSSATRNSDDPIMITKKVLPVPPSLSNRIRQIFVSKIHSQQVQSCAQLPRRKKKPPPPAVEG